ncbi:MAG TPA: molecular chaperone TorD family protein [Pseudonocardiaceae bacterium]
MLDPSQLDTVAAAFVTLGGFHRAAPDETALAAFWELLEDWPLPDTAAAARGLAEMRAARDKPETAEAIRRDHDLLYGDSATAKVPPYESVHRGIEGLLFDEHTLQVRDAYRTLSLRAPRLNREPDDHIGLEFDFVARAAIAALDAIDQAQPARAERAADAGVMFLRDHLLRWAPGMLDRVVAVAQTHFMRGLALLSLGALQSHARLAGLTEPSDVTW